MPHSNSVSATRQQVVVVGDVNADLSMRLPHLPPLGGDAQAKSARWFSGGSALNTAVAYAAVGAPTRLVACVGTDPTADLALAQACARGVDLRYVQRHPTTSTGTCVVCVTGDGHRTFLSHRGANRCLSLASSTEALVDATLVHLSAYALLDAGTADDVLGFLSRAHAQGARIALDLGLPPVLEQRELVLRAARLCWVVGGNEEEMGALGGAEASGESALLACGVTWVATKRGARGAALRSQDGEWQSAAAEARVVDTTACGDAFMAGTTAMLAWGESPDCALAVGAWLGARTAEHEGAADSIPPLLQVEPILQELRRS